MRATILALVLAGCGGGTALTSARSTLALTQRVVTDLDARVTNTPSRPSPPPPGEGESRTDRNREGEVAFQRSVADARSRLDDAEHALESWASEDSGDLAWRTIAPCLGAALSHAADALHAMHAPDDRDLEEAITKLRAESVDECHMAEPDQ